MSIARVTQRDIARVAGVHVTTVSLALRNHHALPVSTRKRIQDIADRMGYRPDPMLSALWAYRKLAKPALHPLTLGYLTAWPTREGWKDREAHLRMYTGAKSHAENLGYQFEHYWLREPGMTAKRWNKIFQTRNLSGMIVAHLPIGRGHLRLDWDRFTAVRIDPPLIWPRLHSVGNNQYRCMQVAYRGAWRNGYRRIGCAMEHVNNERVDMLWSAGYLTEQLRHRIEATIPMLLSREWSKRTFEKWFLTHQPDVVISNHLEILDWFKEMGLRVPKNVGFIDLDCMDLSGVRAGVHQNHEQVGAVAVEVLARMIQHNERGIPLVPQTIVLDGSWVEGATVRRLE